MSAGGLVCSSSSLTRRRLCMVPAGPSPLDEALRFLLGSASLHRAPPTAPIFGPIEKQPRTTSAALDPLQSIGGKEFHGGLNHRPQHTDQLLVFRPVPGEGAALPHQRTVSDGL